MDEQRGGRQLRNERMDVVRFDAERQKYFLYATRSCAEAPRSP